MLLNGFLGNENEIKISVKGNKSSFIGDNFTMECRLIEGRYPNYESVIPKSYANKATFNKAELVNAIRPYNRTMLELKPLLLRYF